MNVERMCRAGRQLKLTLTRPCCFASLALLTVLFLSAESCLAACTTGNPNPNPNPTSFGAVGDFNGDCKSDILWQNSSTGENYIWLMNGTTSLSQMSPGGASSPWTIQAVGDFNGDGMADILWRNSSTGQVYIWLMNGTTPTTQFSPGSPTTDWSIAGVGDFDGDGKADILWQNINTGQLYIWFMNGTTIASQQTPGTVGASWSVLGIGDFNDDGKADILWQNAGTGQTYIWLMNGAATLSQTSPGTVTSEWSIAGVGDFDGDGKSDILWQDGTTGQLYIWFMNGTTIASQQTPGTIAPPNSTVCCDGVGNGWSIAGVGDFDGDGKADILWRQLNTGELYIWLMNGSTSKSQTSPGSAAPPWQVSTLAPYGCGNEVLCNILAGINDVRANGPYGSGNPTPSSEPGGPLNALQWDAGAATLAQNWAAQCNWSHRPNNPYGENIYASEATSTPVAITGTDAANSWNGEASTYTYSSNSCAAGDDCGHYTQDVWRNTNGVGCAVQQCTTGSPNPSFPDWAFVVCDFSPPGNFNSLPPY